MIKKLSKDQQDFYLLCWAVVKGECSTNVASRQLGKCSLVRWLTPASRLLRVYISQVKQS